jgi:hypothetical protein
VVPLFLFLVKVGAGAGALPFLAAFGTLEVVVLAIVINAFLGPRWDVRGALVDGNFEEGAFRAPATLAFKVLCFERSDLEVKVEAMNSDRRGFVRAMLRIARLRAEKWNS